MAPISETISNVEQQINDAVESGRSRIDEGRERLRSVVDTTVETAEGRVEQSTSLMREQVNAWQQRSLEDLDRFGTFAVDSTRAIADRLPEVEIPMLDRLPKAEEWTADYFDYVEALVRWQRQLTEDMIAATRGSEQPKAAKKAKKTKKAEAAEAEAA